MVIVITIMMVTIIVPRAEAELAKRAGKHLLIYGRRKVGKTYIATNFLDHDIYVLVRRGGGIYVEGFGPSNIDSYEQFLGFLRSWLKDGKRVVLDEFQRLPRTFLDELQTMSLGGQLILTGSSMHIVKDVISPHSPILGLFSEIRVSLIKPLDIFRSLTDHVAPTVAFALSPYLRDPWTIPYFKGDRTSIGDILLTSKEVVRALIGEIFLEEDKSLSEVYEGIIRSLSVGKWSFGEISDHLYSRKVLDRPDPHAIRPYFNNMEAMDLVKRVPIFGKKEFRYFITSPIMELGFMLDERYNFFQQDLTAHRMDEVVTAAHPFHVERFCGELFSQVYDGVYNYFYSKDFDIDFIITRGKKPVASGEVKWTQKPTQSDIDKFLERTRHIQGDKIFFSKKAVDDPRVISITPSNLLDWIGKSKNWHGGSKK
jgi:hypothetical protein